MTAAKPPAFRPQRFTLHLLPEGVDPATLNDPDLDAEALELDAHRVTVLWADQVKAEAAGASYGITHKARTGLATLWVWAAMVRTGRTSDKFPVFQARVVDIGDGDDQADPEADPEGAAGPT